MQDETITNRTCPECEQPLWPRNRNGFCRRHRYLSPTYQATMAKATAACTARNPNRYREASERYKQRHPNGRKEATYRWRRKNPEAMATLMRKARRERPEVYRAIGTRAAARRRALEINAAGSFSRYDITLKGEYQGWCCFWCCTDITSGWSIDHKIALSRGGTNWPANLALACFTCNVRKNAADWRTWWVQKLTHAPPIRF